MKTPEELMLKEAESVPVNQYVNYRIVGKILFRLVQSEKRTTDWYTYD